MCEGDAHKMVSHLDDLGEIWDTLDTCYERPEKCMEEALKPVLEFRKHRAFDSSAVREFYSILRAAIKGARNIGRLDLLINDQTVPKIMGKMPYTDWREWATKRPEWIREDLGTAFERFVERKWEDALNVAAAEPQPWESEGPKKEKTTNSKAVGERAPQGQKGAIKTVGAANVATQQPAWGRRKCQVQEQMGCEGDHLALRCGKLRKLSLTERRKALEASGLCMFCLRHPADVECFDLGGRTKPACVQPGCKGKHELLGGVDASINLVAEEDHGMEEDEDLYVNVARVGQEEDDWQEPDDSWLDLDWGESEEEAGVYCISACMRRDDSGLEDELEYFHDVTPPPEEEETVEDRWWSPEPQGPRSEEDEEDNRYINDLLMGNLEAEGDKPRLVRPQAEVGVALADQDRQALSEGPEEEGGHQEGVADSEPPPHEAHGGHHEVILEVMKNMALGLEMAKSMAIGVEVTKVRATILQRWDWYGPSPRTTSDGLHRPDPRGAARAEPLREAPNCTTATDRAGELNAREGIAFGLQIMGVFTLCGLLAHSGLGRHDRSHSGDFQSLANGGNQGE